VSDSNEVLTDFKKGVQAPHIAQVRVYLLTPARPPAEALSAALPDYRLFLPHSAQEAAFIRQVSMQSEAQFRSECERVAKVLAPGLPAESYLSCAYDDDRGRTSFNVELEKTGDSREFRFR